MIWSIQGVTTIYYNESMATGEALNSSWAYASKMLYPYEIHRLSVSAPIKNGIFFLELHTNQCNCTTFHQWMHVFLKVERAEALECSEWIGKEHNSLFWDTESVCARERERGGGGVIESEKERKNKIPSNF